MSSTEQFGAVTEEIGSHPAPPPRPPGYRGGMLRPQPRRDPWERATWVALFILLAQFDVAVGALLAIVGWHFLRGS